MLRIYITKTDIEGKHEGCGCCSYETSANIEDVKSLMKRLDEQKYQLALLAEIMEDYSRDEIIRWFGIYEQIREEKSAIDAGKKYQLNPSILGTFYKDSFENLIQHVKNFTRLEKEYKKLPAVFKKYMKEVTQ